MVTLGNGISFCKAFSLCLLDQRKSVKRFSGRSASLDNVQFGCRGGVSPPVSCVTVCFVDEGIKQVLIVCNALSFSHLRCQLPPGGSLGLSVLFVRCVSVLFVGIECYSREEKQITPSKRTIAVRLLSAGISDKHQIRINVMKCPTPPLRCMCEQHGHHGANALPPSPLLCGKLLFSICYNRLH